MWHTDRAEDFQLSAWFGLLGADGADVMMSLSPFHALHCVMHMHIIMYIFLYYHIHDKLNYRRIMPQMDGLMLCSDTAKDDLKVRP